MSADSVNEREFPESVQRVVRTSGAPLEATIRSQMERSFGHDFGEIRVHTDTPAAESARELNALAYTYGHHVAFAAGQYAPGTSRGNRVLAHELAHSIQQEGGSKPPLQTFLSGGANDVAEREAELAAKDVGEGLRVSAVSKRPRAPMRQTVEQGPALESTVEGTCGPDVTDWFVSVIANAKRDSRTLAIQSDLLSARRIGGRYGYSATDVLEGGIARQVLSAATRAGSPPRTVEASRQLAAADPRNQFGRALLAATAPIPFVGAPEQSMLGLIRRAGMTWKSLVRTGAVWDFKNNVLSKGALRGANCGEDCPDPPTVMLAGFCVEHDLPGNLFYAHIGGFCGFSLNALQLGSQFAELQRDSSSSWDPPEDTAAIALGFGLPSVVSRPTLEAAVRGGAGRIRIRTCSECPVSWTP